MPFVSNIDDQQMIGKVFDRLTVVSFAGRTKHGTLKWTCKCSCGNETTTLGSNLRRGVCRSCGCYAKERIGNSRRIHGLSRSRVYRIWKNMVMRCHNPNDIGFDNYGGREDHPVIVLDEWRFNFMAFYVWSMANGYRDDLTINRVNNDLSYGPHNCNWVSMAEQNQNQRTTKMTPELVKQIRADPRSHTEIASNYDVDQSTVTRIKNRQTWANIE